MKRLIIRSFLIIAMTVVSSLSFAQKSVLSPAICASISSETIAKDILSLIETGADEGMGKCQLSQGLRSVRVSSHSRDFFSRRVVLNAGDQVVITSPVLEGQDAYGPSNEFTVRYEIRKAGSQVIPGAFTFTRLYEGSYIRELGCAMIQSEPTTSFIKRECL